MKRHSKLLFVVDSWAKPEHQLKALHEWGCAIKTLHAVVTQIYVKMLFRSDLPITRVRPFYSNGRNKLSQMILTTLPMWLTWHQLGPCNLSSHQPFFSGDEPMLLTQRLCTNAIQVIYSEYIVVKSCNRQQYCSTYISLPCQKITPSKKSILPRVVVTDILVVHITLLTSPPNSRVLSLQKN